MEVTNNPSLTSKQVKTYSNEIIGRAMLAVKLGGQYGGNRDVYQALGYKRVLRFDDYYSRYLRQDIAKAIIDRPVKATWQGPLELIESDIAEDTEFEEAWEKLNRRLGLKTILSRIDRLTGIGYYGVLLLGLNDITDRGGFANPVGIGSKELVYLKPFSEKSAKISEFENNPRNPRYGKPIMYDIEVADAFGNSSQIIKVHYSRIIHITDDNMESEILGTPRLEAVYNRLVDLEKIVGADAEMFWRGARPGFKSKTDPEYTMTKETKDDLLDQLDEYENDLRRFLTLEGVDVEALTQTIADPGPHFQVQLQCISAQTGIPIRVLTGSERGELASTQDTGEWLSYVQGRREDHAEPRIVRPTVDRLIELGILPAPGENYTVLWQDLFSISEKARVEIGKGRANALREFTTNPIAMEVMPPDAFLEKCIGFTTDEITLIKKMRDEQLTGELMDIVEEQLLAPPAPPAGGTGGTAPSRSAKPKVTPSNR